MSSTAQWVPAVQWLEQHDDTTRQVDNGGQALSEQDFDSEVAAYRWKLALAEQAIADLNRQLRASRRELYEVRSAHAAAA